MDSSGLDGLTVFPPGRVLEGSGGREGGTGAKRGGGGVGGKQWVKEERRGLCAEGPKPRTSHPEDLCSLAGWIQRRQGETVERGNERKGEREKKTRGERLKKVHGRAREREGGIARRTGPDCSPPVPPPCGLQGGSCSLSEFPSGTDLRAPGSKLKYELQEERMGGGTERRERPKNEGQTRI